MTEQDNPPLTPQERSLRTIRANALWGIGADSCHDDRSKDSPLSHAPKPGEKFYEMIIDVETGELSFEPGNIE